jgi:predicted nucleotidyltransferase
MKAAPSRFDSLLRSATDAVLELFPDIEALYVFGSIARGEATAESDLDLAVLMATPIEPLVRFDMQRDLSARLGRDVDLVDLHNANSVLRSEVVNGGVSLFQRDPMRTLEFEARVLGEYADLLDATRELRGDIHVRGRVLA